MGFGGGGSSQLANHVHNSVPLQGGPLDFKNDTIAGMSAGSVVYSDGVALQELLKPAVPTGETLTYPALATAPTWASAGGGVWEVMYQDYNQAGVDSGFIAAMGEKRWLDIYVSGYWSVGSPTTGPQLQFYDPDGGLSAGTHYTSGGFYNGTFYTTGSGANIPLTFNQAVTADRPFFFNMKVLTSPVGKPAGGACGFSWQGTHRIAPAASYWSGNGVILDGYTDPSEMFCNGIKLVEGNTYQDCMMTILGSGDNTV